MAKGRPAVTGFDQFRRRGRAKDGAADHPERECDERDDPPGDEAHRRQQPPPEGSDRCKETPDARKSARKHLANDG